MESVDSKVKLGVAPSVCIIHLESWTRMLAASAGFSVASAPVLVDVVAAPLRAAAASTHGHE